MVCIVLEAHMPVIIIYNIAAYAPLSFKGSNVLDLEALERF